MVLAIFVIGIQSGGTTAQATYLALGISGVWLVVSVVYFVIVQRAPRAAHRPACQHSRRKRVNSCSSF